MATTTKDDTTVTITGSNGESSGPFPLDELEQHGNDIARAAGLPRSLRAEQLTFDVGLPGNQPEYGSVKIGGSLTVDQDLAYGQEFRIVITTLDGEKIADREVKVAAVQFKRHSNGFTERIHTVSA